MIKQTLHRLCESPRRWLIVTAGTFVVGLVWILPLVDVYCAERNEKKALIAEVEAASRLSQQIEKYESRVGERVAELEALQSRTAGEEQMPALRDRLVELARETGCSLRRLDLGEEMTRPWNPDDMPTDPKPSVLGKKQPETGFELQWRPVSISVSGTVGDLRNFLEKLKADNMLVYTKSFEIYPSSMARKSLTMDMDLWYFALTSVRGVPQAKL